MSLFLRDKEIRFLRRASAHAMQRPAAVSAAFVLLVLVLLRALPGGPIGSISYSRAVYDRHERLIRVTLSDDQKYRIKTGLSSMPAPLVDAALRREDRYFHFHPGVNPVSVFRALAAYASGRPLTGASTITMQTARLLYGLRTKRLSGKMLQMLAALWIELRHSKVQILEAYLNLVPLGGNIEGIGAASLIYYGQAPSELNPVQAMTLCVLPPSPNALTRPLASTAGVVRRREALLNWWTYRHPEYARLINATEHPTRLRRTQLPFLAPHFSNEALSATREGDLRTTLDLDLQQSVERQLAGFVASRRKQGIDNASALVVDVFTAEIRASVGSADFFREDIEGQVDGTMAYRSPGSALKPMLYALALDQGLIHPKTVLKDAPTRISSYSPENFEGDFAGPISAEAALAQSRNVPAVQIAQRLTRPDLYDLLKSAGVKLPRSKDYYGLSPVLGGVELSMQDLAALYLMLANRGVHRPLIHSRAARRPAGTALIGSESAYMVLQMLGVSQRPHDNVSDVWTRRTTPVYWKTGTSMSFRDAWCAAVIGHYVVIVWVGRFDGAGNAAFVGREAAAPLLFKIVDSLRAIEPDMGDVVTRPDNVQKIEVCAISGKFPGKHCGARSLTDFIPGRSPIEMCDVHREVVVDLDSGLRGCGRPGRTRREVFEVWPSDLLRLFHLAGITRREPPSFDSRCVLTGSARGIAPSISTPVRGVSYSVGAGRDDIALSAVTDAAVKEIYWFVDEGFVARAARDKTYFWKGVPGRHQIRVVDDAGLADSLEVNIEAVE